MQCKITNNSALNIDELSPLIDDLASHIQNKMGFASMPAITMQDDVDNADVLHGRTAQYDPDNRVITVYVTKRHPKDIMRSIAHEFIHHAQNERGEFDKFPITTTTGYAQQDPHLRKMEKEAYLKGNMCFRDWEDGYKRNLMESIHRQNKLSRRNDTMKIHKWKNNELNRLLMEKFGYGEAKPTEDDNEQLEEAGCNSGNRKDKAHKHDEEEEKKASGEETVEEGAYNRSKEEEEDEKEQQNEGEVPAGLKKYQDEQKAQKAKQGDDKEDKDKDDEKEDKSKSGDKLEMETDTKDKDKDGETDDKVPAFLYKEGDEEIQEESFRDRVRALMEQVLELE